MKVNEAELRKVPYLDIQTAKGRTVNLMPLWDGRDWTIWVPTPSGLQTMRPKDTRQVDYVGQSPASPTDLLIPFVEFLWQRASWDDVFPLILGIKDDIHNLATALAKIEHFFEFRESIGSGVSAFVATELEYLFTLSRSLFDLLQECISRIWDKKIVLLDKDAQQRKRQLPNSFVRIVLEEKKRARTAPEIEQKFAIPQALAQGYASVAPVFLQLRNLRDDLLHSGAKVPFIFVTDKGFCVDNTQRPFNAFNIWTKDHVFNEHLMSLKPFLAHIVFHTIGACNILFFSFAQQIQFPDPIAPGYRVFVRSDHNSALVRAKDALEGGNPWWNEAVREVTEKTS